MAVLVITYFKKLNNIINLSNYYHLSYYQIIDLPIQSLDLSGNQIIEIDGINHLINL